MAKTLAELRERVLKRLGDTDQRIWSAAEVDASLRAGYRELALASRIFWDMRYLENLPAGFSYTATWEKVEGFVTYDYGLANFTLDDERRLLDEYEALGPANHTCPREAVGLYLDACDASTSIPATVDLPEAVLEIERATWDEATIDAATPQRLSPQDSRYELTEGEVFGYTWRKDGMRTFRKVRKPAAQADTYTIEGSWGLVRNYEDLTDASLQTYSAEVLADSPIQYFHLGETSGPTAADASGNARHGTYTGSGWSYSAARAFAIAGNAVATTGSNGTYIDATSGWAAGTGGLTLECWVKTTAGDTTTRYIADNKSGGSNTAGFNLGTTAGTTLFFAVANGSSRYQLNATVHGINDGAYHHVIAMLERLYDGVHDRLVLYVDGQFVKAGDVPAAGWNITTTWRLDLGRLLASDGNSWVGSLDEWAVYFTTLSQARIEAHYAAATCSWGVLRRVPTHHPFGDSFWGAVRRPFQEGKNVRVEHWRTGRLMEADDDACELPDRYALYLCEYAQAKALSRNGPGQDVKLAGHFDRLWQRGLARVASRGERVLKGRVGVLGGAARAFGHRPPRPRLPWAYGRIVQ